jgi:hypothetical protein
LRKPILSLAIFILLFPATGFSALSCAGVFQPLVISRQGFYLNHSSYGHELLSFPESSRTYFREFTDGSRQEAEPGGQWKTVGDSSSHRRRVEQLLYGRLDPRTAQQDQNSSGLYESEMQRAAQVRENSRIGDRVEETLDRSISTENRFGVGVHYQFEGMNLEVVQGYADGTVVLRGLSPQGLVRLRFRHAGDRLVFLDYVGS